MILRFPYICRPSLSQHPMEEKETFTFNIGLSVSVSVSVSCVIRMRAKRRKNQTETQKYYNTMFRFLYGAACLYAL